VNLLERDAELATLVSRWEQARSEAGLTTRQVEVLRLLGEGLTNAEVAERLFISPKTADHHVSAILTKLGVPTRRDAVRAARQLDLLV
jgi:DNA-binding NarL/FixJ family response regulator